MTAVPSVPAQGSQPKQRQAGLILLVEDDPKLRRLYTDVLSATGYTVLSAPSGKEGLNLLMSNVPKVVILDIMLPDINGIEICRRARQALGEKIPIIFLSSLDQIDVLESCIEAGGDDFIVKGSNLQAMTMRIQHWAKSGAANKNREHRERVLNAIHAVTQPPKPCGPAEQARLTSATDKARRRHLPARRQGTQGGARIRQVRRRKDVPVRLCDRRRALHGDQPEPSQGAPERLYPRRHDRVRPVQRARDRPHGPGHRSS